jgi:hypothetical protein
VRAEQQRAADKVRDRLAERAVDVGTRPGVWGLGQLLSWPLMCHSAPLRGARRGGACGLAAGPRTRAHLGETLDPHKHHATTDELMIDRLVSPIPLPPDCPASATRVGLGLAAVG